MVRVWLPLLLFALLLTSCSSGSGSGDAPAPETAYADRYVDSVNDIINRTTGRPARDFAPGVDVADVKVVDEGDAFRFIIETTEPIPDETEFLEYRIFLNSWAGECAYPVYERDGGWRSAGFIPGDTDEDESVCVAPTWAFPSDDVIEITIEKVRFASSEPISWWMDVHTWDSDPIHIDFIPNSRVARPLN